MNAFDIIRAWKDEAYRASLTASQLAALPPNPAGMVEFAETDLDLVVGGRSGLRDYTDPGSGCGTGGGNNTGTGNRTGVICGMGNGSNAVRRLRVGENR